MDNGNFAKGLGVGFVVGSVVGMSVFGAGTQKRQIQTKKSMVSRALKTMGDIVENIGESMGM